MGMCIYVSCVLITNDAVIWISGGMLLIFATVSRPSVVVPANAHRRACVCMFYRSKGAVTSISLGVLIFALYTIEIITNRSLVFII